MSDYNKLGLYSHNIESYEKIKDQLKKDNIAAIVHATGTGKSFNALQLALDNKDKKITYVVPYNSVIEHLKKLIEKNNNISLKEDFSNIEFKTYRSFVNMSAKEIESLDLDLLILDEFHHIGAPIWGARINELINTHKDIKILGMTAYTVRDRATSYERDMVNPETNELFSNKVVSRYDLCDAMIDGVLPKPNYKSGYVYLEKTYEYLEEKLNSLNQNSKDYKDLSPILKDIKQRVHEAPSIGDIFKTNIKRNGKYIYFCPLISEENINDIDTIIKETKRWLKEIGLTEKDYEIYMTTSEMGEEGENNRDAFYNDLDLEKKSTKDKLRIMFTINQYNEGVHAPGLDGVIMGRSTQSDIVYFEQLGRALSAGTHNKEERNLLETKSKEELIQLCQARGLKYQTSDDNNDLIDILVAPTIIDLTNNIGYMKDLENNLQDRIKDIMQNKLTAKRREIHLGSYSFDIDMLNEDLYKVIEYMNERLTMTWDNKYDLAKNYFKHYDNLEIPVGFKTINGYDYDENGVKVGLWVSNQRTGFKAGKLSPEQIKKLEEIGMRFKTKNTEQEWNNKYSLAKIYFEHYGHLEIPADFKTVNGYDYDENGVNLGMWIYTQRRPQNRIEANKTVSERIKRLEEIGMRFETTKLEQEWNNKYNLAKNYYEHHGDLRIPSKFKTINGYEYNENGVNLGSWINTQYSVMEVGNLTPERIKRLEEIGINFEAKRLEQEWNNKYKLAKKYFEHHGNLEIPAKFKTINGYDYDENGVKVGLWITNQRASLKLGQISPERIKKLEEIGMRFEANRFEQEWNNKYNLAKNYYEHYGNLKISSSFKTINGYDYDENGINLGGWIDTQRKSYYGKGTCKITLEQINKLEEIGMNFNANKFEQEWNNKYNLAKNYYEHHGNLEIPVHFKTINGYEYDKNGDSLGGWISRQRQDYNGNDSGMITPTQIKKLEEINMRWHSEHIDNKLQKEAITEDNKLKKRNEVFNRLYSLLNKYESDKLPTKEQINNDYIESLNNQSVNKM